MKRIILTVGGLALVFMTGCIVTSVNPLYTEKDLVFDPALIGAWGEDNDKNTWAFEQAGEKQYKLLHTDDKGRTGTFEAHLLKLDKYQFLDLHLIDPGEKEEWQINELAAVAIIMRPGHLFFKISQIQPTLQLSPLHEDWLKKVLEKDPKAIQHERIHFGSDNTNDYRYVLTADTKALQKLVLKYADSEEAFGDKPGELQRKETPPVVEKPEKK
jgi:hypothetical protein